MTDAIRSASPGEGTHSVEPDLSLLTLPRNVCGTLTGPEATLALVVNPSRAGMNSDIRSIYIYEISKNYVL